MIQQHNEFVCMLVSAYSRCGDLSILACGSLYEAGDPVVIARGLPPASANEFIRRMLDLVMRPSLSAAKELNASSLFSEKQCGNSHRYIRKLRDTISVSDV